MSALRSDGRFETDDRAAIAQTRRLLEATGKRDPEHQIHVVSWGGLKGAFKTG